MVYWLSENYQQKWKRITLLRSQIGCLCFVLFCFLFLFFFCIVLELFLSFYKDWSRHSNFEKKKSFFWKKRMKNSYCFLFSECFHPHLRKPIAAKSHPPSIHCLTVIMTLYGVFSQKPLRSFESTVNPFKQIRQKVNANYEFKCK